MKLYGNIVIGNLLELIILNIGLELGIISQAVFSMLVLMAAITTLMTGPLIRLFLSDLFDQVIPPKNHGAQK